MQYKNVEYLLPLEQHAIYMQIQAELDLVGYSLMIKNGSSFDFRASVFEVLNHINAMFPESGIPFWYIFESACSYVMEWRDHWQVVLRKANATKNAPAEGGSVKKLIE